MPQRATCFSMAKLPATFTLTKTRPPWFSQAPGKAGNIVVALIRPLGETLSRVWEELRKAERGRVSTTAASKIGTLPSARDRREKFRHLHRVPVLIYGSDVEKQPFHEEALTIDANETGCLIAIESAVSHGQRLFLTNTLNQAEQECRVVHIGRRSRGKAPVGVAFARPAPNFWRPA
jgi:hypothetical protein